MTAPGTLLMAKMLVPETEEPLTAGKVHMASGERDPNFLAAIARGTTEGLHLALNVGAMLIAFLALICAMQRDHGRHAQLAGRPPLGMVSRRACSRSSAGSSRRWHWSSAFPGTTARRSATCWASRMVLNELVAFSFLGPMKGALDPRSFTIATFALCGFANFSSIGMQIGGIGALAPNKPQRSRQARHSRDARGHHGEFDVRFDCGDVSAMSACRRQAPEQGGAPGRRISCAPSTPRNLFWAEHNCARASAWCWAAAWALSRTSMASASAHRLRKIPHFPRSTAIGPCGAHGDWQGKWA